MKKLKSYSQWDYVSPKGEVNDFPSKTVPDQSQSVQEIMRRYASGLPLTGLKVPIYDDGEEDQVPDFDSMDISEIHNYTTDVQKQISDLEQKRLKKEAEINYARRFQLDYERKQKEAAKKEAARKNDKPDA